MLLRRSSFALVCLALAALAACASPARWEKAGVRDDRRAADIRQCRARASAYLRSERNYRREVLYGSAVNAADVGRNDDLAGRRRMMEADGLRTRDAQIADCMRRKGYIRARSGEAGK